MENFDATMGAQTPSVAPITEVEETPVIISLELREKIKAKKAEIRQKTGKKRIYSIVVKGWEDDEKPLYIAYLSQPNLMQFSQYMSFIQKDVVQANKMLANAIFVEGDRELVDDDDLFLYGLMPQLSKIIDSRQGELVNR